MSNHHHPPEDRDWHEYQDWLETHDYAVINNAIALIRAHCKSHHYWVCDRLLEVRHRAAYAETRLAELAAKEETYRFIHDCEGDESSLVVGRAWDAMRRAGQKARDFLRRKEWESAKTAVPRDVLLDAQLLKHTSCLYEIMKAMEQLAESRPDDFDVKGYAMSLRGLWMEMKEP